jgi:hypothetical protein
VNPVVPADNNGGNEAPVQIEDPEVPLIVNPDDEPVEDDTPNTVIEDDETPKADNVKADGVKSWWWWLAAAAAAVTGKGVYDRQRRKATDSDDENSEE